MGRRKGETAGDCPPPPFKLYGNTACERLTRGGGIRERRRRRGQSLSLFCREGEMPREKKAIKRDGIFAAGLPGIESLRDSGRPERVLLWF